MVYTAGFNDCGWMDVAGHPRGESLRVQEHSYRLDVGHLWKDAIGASLLPFCGADEYGATARDVPLAQSWPTRDTREVL